MPFVVTENCIKCKHTDCVEVCPVDCFHEGPNFLVIDPDECIDCTPVSYTHLDVYKRQY